MTTIAIRKKLHDLIANMDDSKVNGMYLLLEDEINKKTGFELSPRHLEILEEERSNHLKGKSRSYTWAEVKQKIKEK